MPVSPTGSNYAILILFAAEPAAMSEVFYDAKALLEMIEHKHFRKFSISYLGL